MPSPQGRYFLLTIPTAAYDTPSLVAPVIYLKGQKEIGASGYSHWQLLAITDKKCTISAVKRCFCSQAHVELSRSAAANDYVWKDDTAVPDSRIELGTLPINRSKKHDWDRIWSSAISGDMESIPKDVLLRSYTNIKRIRVDYMVPSPRPDIFVSVFYGPTGTGKTHRAWHEAGTDVYIKNPNTKWWDGYRGQKNVIIDEFIGRIDISYLLTWLDKYPCNVEVKGFSVPLEGVKFWITSNLAVDEWYPDASDNHKAALKRRLNKIEKMVLPFYPNTPNPAGLTNHPNTPNPNRVIDLSFLLED